jgi:hypothetical protein
VIKSVGLDELFKMVLTIYGFDIHDFFHLIYILNFFSLNY